MMFFSSRIQISRATACAVGVGASGWAHAHVGLDTGGAMAGLVHPLGWDHLLAMLAVGLWSFAALPAHRIWLGPAVFLGGLMIGALCGWAGIGVPALEPLIAASVVLLGLMVISPMWYAASWGFALLALAASLHGLAHGAEAPATGSMAYGIGFLITSTLLHVGGVGLGLIVRHIGKTRATPLLQTIGLGVGGAGLALLWRL